MQAHVSTRGACAYVRVHAGVVAQVPRVMRVRLVETRRAYVFNPLCASALAYTYAHASIQKLRVRVCA